MEKTDSDKNNERVVLVTSRTSFDKHDLFYFVVVIVVHEG